MKPCIKNLFPCLGIASTRSRVLPALIAGLGLILAGRVAAQTFTTLHSFTATSGSTNSDGANPYAGLILSSHILYGTTQFGGSSGKGTVFAINTDGTGFTNLHSFSGLNNNTNSDGANPQASLTLSGNILYGTTQFGGSSGKGTVFAVNTDGTGFTNLHRFSGLNNNTNSDGANPQASLTLSGNTMYGTAVYGGSSGAGTVFAINTDGTGFTNLHSLTAIPSSFPYTNSDGAIPRAGLVLSGDTLYGTAFVGGSSGVGTVFAVSTDGTGFTNVHTFTNGSGGALPSARLILSGNTLYGTTVQGASSGNGVVFAVNTDGTGFENLHSFTGNSGGQYPVVGVILSGNTLYGTAQYGGDSGNGTVFAVNTDGTGFTNVHSFMARFGSNFTNSDGSYPQGDLILSGKTLYGTAFNGGRSGKGTIFSISFVPQLTIILSVANVILTWPTNIAGFDYSGFTLQSTTNLVSPAVWTPVVPGPVVVNGQNTVTNPISGTQQFYRLSQ